MSWGVWGCVCPGIGEGEEKEALRNGPIQAGVRGGGPENCLNISGAPPPPGFSVLGVTFHLHLGNEYLSQTWLSSLLLGVQPG